MNQLKSLGIVKKQKDAGYRCNYCQFQCGSQLQMIHHNSSCFFSQYDGMKKRTGLRRSQLKEQDKKQKRAIKNILNSKIIKNNIDIEKVNNQLKNEEEQSKTYKQQDWNNHNLDEVPEDQNEIIDLIDQFMIKGDEKNYIYSMMVLKNRSDLRLNWDWPQHEKFTKEFEGFKMTEIGTDLRTILELNEISEQNFEITSNANLKQQQRLHIDKQSINQIKVDSKEDSIQNPIKNLVQSIEIINDKSSLKRQEIKQQITQYVHKNEESIIVKHQDLVIQQNNNIENQDIKSEIIMKGPSKQESHIQSDDEEISFLDTKKTNDQFYLILQQAHFELINRNQLKKVHKILINYYDQVRLDVLGIDKVWGLVQSKHSQAILNYRQLLKCLLDLHDQEKIQLDEHKQILYLI